MTPAYCFDCDECGRENIVRCIIPEFSLAERKELDESFGIQEDELGTFIDVPLQVTCKFCGEMFTPEYFDGVDLDED
jgi:hypothetical protein